MDLPAVSARERAQYWVDASQARLLTKVWMPGMPEPKSARIITLSALTVIYPGRGPNDHPLTLLHGSVIVVEYPGAEPGKDYIEERYKILKRRGHVFWVQDLVTEGRTFIKIEGSRYREP